ncbi:beta-ketoacyl synthase N-terminal-like domain-containing protein [Cellulomonas palmilytica]|uniref:beta-ketoacyl synthase N-terminal-like domain-containing protein n=1 Tax=Cellulomonas palmilytica TaxID=2608402 RepID=UPI001F45230E|nr:beta-ketoacyl synthase N-terminal-like domain-containing protein [Cellulomonas palmilytica]UJP40454.1 hypothetical protein F1D97_02695 [Cellulomonas palmilytica]
MTTQPTHRQHNHREHTRSEPQREHHRDSVSVVGVALRVPGADHPDAFWDLTVHGRTTFEQVDRDDSREAGYRDEQLADPAFVPVRSALGDVAAFDADAFGISARDAALMDPQQRVFLETVRQALDDAGLGVDGDDDLRALRVGVFGSSSSSTYLPGPVTRAGLWDATDLNFSAMLANDKDFLCTRTSYTLGLTGPSVVVQSACSSSLLAVHLARAALLAGECDVAVVGGVSVSLPHLGGYLHRAGSIFSARGTCRPFDAAADGTVKAHGAAAIVLTRTAHAPADRVYVEVAGSAVNNDGADKVGYPAPSVAGQSAVVAAALRDAGLTADDVRYVETHGTGTAIGDPIELRALALARGLGDGTTSAPCYLGAVKGNLGHLDAAAGVTGVIKAALVLERGVVPPLAGFSTPNPLLTTDGFAFPTSPVDAPWLEAAGVSSFGMGGTNVHVVLRRRADRARRPAVWGGRTLRRTRHWLDDAVATAPVAPAASAGLGAFAAPVAVPVAAPVTASGSAVVGQVEPQVLAIARRLLVHPTLAPHDDLVDAGADSLTLVDLLATLRDDVDPALEFADLEQARTVAALAATIAARRTSSDPSPGPDAPAATQGADDARPAALTAPVGLVRVTAPRERTVYLVHPAGGTTTCYAGLAPHLDPRLGVVAIGYPPELVGHGPSLRALAATYLQAIRAAQPHGPYLIGGYSFGGNLAAEMALQLEQAGEEVEHLVMVDSHPPHAYTSGDCGPEDYLAAFPALLHALVPGLRLGPGVAGARDARDVLERVVEPAWPTSVRDELARFFDMWQENHRALKRWTPDADLTCPVLVVEASRPEPPEVLDRLGIAHTSVREWQRYASSLVAYAPVEGDHYSIFRDDDALATIARALSSVLDTAAAGHHDPALAGTR